MKHAKYIIAVFLISGAAWAQMTFYPVDSFEDGNYNMNPEWYSFGNVKLEIVKNPSLPKIDFVSQSGGEHSLNIRGRARDWYVGGLGFNTLIDASGYSRFQIDVAGNQKFNNGKIKVEIYEDEHGSGNIKLDPKNNWLPMQDDLWYVELNILGQGVARYSVPFSSFVLANPGVGDGKMRLDKIAKIQIIAVAGSQEGTIDFNIDNLMFTY